MEAIEIGSSQMPLNTVGNSVTFNKKLLLQLGIITAVAAVIGSVALIIFRPVFT